MLHAYLNYPNSIISIHSDDACGAIMRMRKDKQRTVCINRESLSIELTRFKEEHKFASEAARNDMWITVEMDDYSFEVCIIAYIKKILGLRYKPFRDADIKKHCYNDPHPVTAST